MSAVPLARPYSPPVSISVERGDLAYLMACGHGNRRGKYACVYETKGRDGKDRGRPYKVFIRKGNVYLGTYETEEEAAQVVVRWYKWRFGWRWKRVVEKGKTNPWLVKRVGKTFVVWIWICGTRLRLGAWPTRKQAHTIRRRFCRLFEECVDEEGRTALLVV